MFFSFVSFCLLYFETYAIVYLQIYDFIVYSLCTLKFIVSYGLDPFITLKSTSLYLIILVKIYVQY